MKIAIPSDDGIHLSQHFGRTRGFVVVETENGMITGTTYRSNDFTGHAMGMHHGHGHDHGAESHEHDQGGHGHGAHSHHGILEALRDCEVVIAGGMGYRLFEDLTLAGKTVVNTTRPVVLNAAEAYLAGGLTSDKDACHSHH